MAVALDRPMASTLSKKAPIVVERPMFRALPGIDLVFLVAIGIAGLAACFAIGLQ
jgi:hypothetical protein